MLFSIGVSRDQYSFDGNIYLLLLGDCRDGPLKVKNIVCHVPPLLSQVSSHIQLFKDLAIVFPVVFAISPASSHRPVVLRWMECELMYLLPRIECPNGCTTVSSDVINSSRSQKHDNARISR